MAEFYDKEGNVVTGFSEEEVQAKAAEAAAAEVAKRTEAESALAKAVAERDALADTDKDKNFANLRDGLKKKDEEIEALRKDVETTKATQAAETRKEILASLVGDDAELAKKIEEEMAQFRTQPTTKAETLELAKKALAIVKPAVAPGAFDGFMNGGGRAPSAGENGKEYTPPAELKSVGSKMGISEEDWKKYGGK